RGALFVALVAAVLFLPPGPGSRAVVLAIFAADLANTVADVLLERSSRARLGGLPSGESLVHILGSLLMGVGLATFWWRAADEALPRSALVVGLGVSTLIGASSVLALEACLFARALRVAE